MLHVRFLKIHDSFCLSIGLENLVKANMEFSFQAVFDASFKQSSAMLILL